MSNFDLPEYQGAPGRNPTELDMLKKIWYWVYRSAVALTGGGVPVVVSPASVTPNEVLLGASASQVIPVGAKGWTVSILTGTATVGSAAGLPAGFSDSDPNTLLASLTVTTAAASSAYVRWNT